MTIAANSIQRVPLRRLPLAACLGAVLFAAVPLTGSAQTTANTQRVPFRADPARRIFTALPAVRVTPQRSPSAATTWSVLNCDDDGPGSLRATVAGVSTGDTVDLTALACATITLETGAILVPVDDLTLVGPGRAALAIDGNSLDRVFIHPYGGNLTFSALTIQHGRDRATGFHVAGGGCIASAGYLTLDATTVDSCYAGGEGSYGGGIYAYSLTMSSSTISGNTALGVHESSGTAASGGAAFVYTMQLVDSTISGNRAAYRANPPLSSYGIGGGILTVRGGNVSGSTIDSNFSGGRGGGIGTFSSISVYNSTISGNTAETEIGGGLFLRWPSTLNLNNSTITSNRAAEDGNGIWLNAPGSSFQSSIVFGNAVGDAADIGNRANDFSTAVATTIDGSNNLMGSTSPLVTPPSDTSHADPRLSPLAFNGGVTRTHALRAGSAAVDAGSNPAALSFDQRGADFPRVYGAAPDIGAFEQQALVPLVEVPVPTLSIEWLSLLASCFGIAGGIRLRMCQSIGRVANSG